MDGWVRERVNEWMHDWVDGWVRERVNEWMHDWVDGWVNECTPHRLNAGYARCLYKAC